MCKYICVSDSHLLAKGNIQSILNFGRFVKNEHTFGDIWK